MPVSATALALVLVRVMPCELLYDKPTIWLPNPIESREIETVPVTPVPVSVNGSDVPPATMFIVADRSPVADARKVTQKLQLELAPRVAPQVLLVIVKSPTPAMPVSATALALVLVRVMPCELLYDKPTIWLPNPIESREIETVPVTPVPFSVNGSDVPPATMLIVADRSPVADARKVTQKLQLELAPRVAPQVLLLTLKSPTPARPVTEMALALVLVSHTGTPLLL
jgi:hypothetical protein